MPATKAAPQNEAERQFYEDNAQAYVVATIDVDMSDLYAEFLPHVPLGGRILDAGSGSGRDTLAFAKKGYVVEAFDSSPALAQISSRLTGIQTQVVRFQDFSSVPRFDGIWACASLLHVPKRELPDSLARLSAALKPKGILYASFKHGSRERLSRDGRIFVDLTSDRLCALLAPFTNLAVKKIWVTKGEGILRGKDQWLNVLATKTGEARNA